MSQIQASRQETIMMNGVNVTGIFDTIAAVKSKASLAEFQFRAKNTWLGGGHNRSTVQGFFGCGEEDHARKVPFIFDADEPPVLLGKDSGANPVEFVLHALAGCLTTTLAYHAAARSIIIEAIDSELEGDLDLRGFLGVSDRVRKGYREIRVKMRVKTKGKADQLRELAQFSPVFDIVSNSLPVRVDVETY